MPLALFVGLLMSVGKLYGDSEMAVLSSVGLGPQKLWRPIVLVTLPVVVAFTVLQRHFVQGVATTGLR